MTNHDLFISAKCPAAAPTIRLAINAKATSRMPIPAMRESRSASETRSANHRVLS